MAEVSPSGLVSIVVSGLFHRTVKENYRPITLLPCVSKVLEKLVRAQINSALGSRFYQNSSAYRKAHSCETTLINLVEDCRLARDPREVVSILSTDNYVKAL